jgi:hypothetical protein
MVIGYVLWNFAIAGAAIYLAATQHLGWLLLLCLLQDIKLEG